MLPGPPRTGPSPSSGISDSGGPTHEPPRRVMQTYWFGTRKSHAPRTFGFQVASRTAVMGFVSLETAAAMESLRLVNVSSVIDLAVLCTHQVSPSFTRRS